MLQFHHAKGAREPTAKAQQPWRKRLVSFGASGTFKIGRERADKWLELKRQHNAPYSRTTAWVCARFGECACRCTNGRDAGNARQYEPAPRKSITFDNDTAFAQHALLRTMRAMTTWFCDAYASWQKGGVENANGRLRRWLPRQIDIDQVSDEEIQDIVITANLTPRKCLGFKTPFQAILKELGKDVQIRFA